MQRQTLAQPDNGLVPFFNVTFGRFTVALIVAFNGGAFVGGVAVPTAYEVAQGQYSALPFFFDGVGLLVCGVVAFVLHDTGRVVFYTIAQTILTAWV